MSLSHPHARTTTNINSRNDRGGHQRVAACCSVLQRVAVCCSVLHCLSFSHTHIQRPMSIFSITEEVTSVLQCVAVCCRCAASVLQCIAVCCSVLQCVAVSLSLIHTHTTTNISSLNDLGGHKCVAVSCSALQRVAVRCRVSLSHTHTYHDQYQQSQ